MGKTIFGILILMAFLFFLRTAWVVISAQYRKQNLRAAREAGIADHEILDLKDEIKASTTTLRERAQQEENSNEKL